MPYRAAQSPQITLTNSDHAMSLRDRECVESSPRGRCTGGQACGPQSVTRCTPRTCPLHPRSDSEHIGTDVHTQRRRRPCARWVVPSSGAHRSSPPLAQAGRAAEGTSVAHHTHARWIRVAILVGFAPSVILVDSGEDRS
eukprot:5524844-Prymnesium_polylepis.1